MPWSGRPRANKRPASSVVTDEFNEFVNPSVNLQRFQHQLDATTELLRNYRTVDGKEDDGLIREITEAAEKLWTGGLPGSSMGKKYAFVLPLKFLISFRFASSWFRYARRS